MYQLSLGLLKDKETNYNGYVGTKRGYISLFSSAGIGCLGFNLENFDCIATSELIQRRLDVQKANGVCSLETGYVAGDMKDPEIVSQLFDAIDEWKTYYKHNEVDVVVATPPCQGISIANHKKKDELARNSLVVESLVFISNVKPKYFVLENVRGFLSTLCTNTDGTDKSVKDAIYLNLAGLYNIASKVVNFKDYGNNSSRTRTLVIGVRKDIEEITPYDLFPVQKTAPTLRNLIADLRSLNKMGEIDPADIYHSFRPYKSHMLEWIEDLGEGASAFDNDDPKKRPHKIVDGKIIENQNKNGDKYTRCLWDKVAPCIHTRNDILASQSTIHPEDNRVFSIRELMRFMTVPSNFKWADVSLTGLNSFSETEKKAFLKKHEMNIRQCLGEAVPTAIFQQIAHNIVQSESEKTVSVQVVKKLIDELGLLNKDKLLSYISNPAVGFVQAMKIAELANTKQLDNAAYYTRQDLCFNLLHDLPDFRQKKNIRILEPSVGVGNFLPTIFEKYLDKQKVHLDLVDISEDSIQVLKKVLKTLKVPANFELRIINADFLLHEFRNTYDLVVGNPPFGKVDATRFADYAAASIGNSARSRNIFALFYEKALKIADVVAFISPKSILNAPEFKPLRILLGQYSIAKINDYGEKGFNGVKIETISMHVNSKLPADKTVVESNVLKSYQVHDQSYVIDHEFPYWLIYRDSYFDEMVGKLELGLFTVYRDRSLTSKNMKSTGRIRVLKSRNILNGSTTQLSEDQFVDSTSVSPIAQKFHNATNVVVAPNLSYYPRATFLPKNTIVDGSAALLVPKTTNISISRQDLTFFASKEYFLFYRIARNYATRSLNIDSSSVYFWGVPKDDLKHEIFEHESRSKFLFARPVELFEAFAA